MKPKATLVLVLILVAPVFSARGQAGANPAVPSVPRADGSGPSVPSMSSAVGDIAVPAPSDAKPASRPIEGAPTAAELDAAAKTTARSAAADASQLAPAPRPAPLGKGGAALPIAKGSKGWALEGAPTVSATGPASPVSEVLDTTTLAQRIRELSLAGRTEFLNAFDVRIERADRDLNQVRQSSRQLKGDSRAAYLAADDDVKAKQKALKRSLREARAATPDTWEKARSTLAADYEAYSVALVRMEASSAVGR